MSNKEIKIIFAGGGTGGHLFPAVAIADRLVDLLGLNKDTQILFIGTKRGIEYRLRDIFKYPQQFISVRGLTRALTLSNLLVPFLLIKSLYEVKAIIKKFKPDLVIGTGGYVCLPVLKIAAKMNILTVVQEQNSYPGIAVKQTVSKADRVYLGFDKARNYLPVNDNIVTTGNPVRNELLNGNRDEAYEHFDLDKNKKTILILGGSQGARAINNAVLKSLENNSIPNDVQLLWQVGKRDYKDVIALAGEKASPHTLFPFTDRMDLVYAVADFAIARAGALAMAELQASSLPTIFVPFPFAADNHQEMNAEVIVENGTGWMIKQDQFDTTDILKSAIVRLQNGSADEIRNRLQDENKSKKNAVDLIAKEIIDLLKNK